MKQFLLCPAAFRLVICLLFLSNYYSLSAQTVSTIAGSAGGYKDGNISPVELYNPTDAVFNAKGELIIADNQNYRVRKISKSGVISDVAGNGIAGFKDGRADSAQFNGISKIAIDKKGNIYVCDNRNSRIRKITPQGTVSTFAGNGIAGLKNGIAADAEFSGPSGIAIDTAGNIFIGEFGNNCIRKITPQGIVSTLAGSGVAGYKNATGTSAQFYGVRGIGIDRQGNIYASDCNNYRIRKITPGGVVTLFAGNGFAGSANGAGVNAQFNLADGVFVDSSGNVYVADQSNDLIRKITPQAIVSTIAGSGVKGYIDGINTTAQFSYPHTAVINNKGEIFISDGLNNSIRKLTATDSVSTYAGNGIAGYANGQIANAELYGPNATAADAAGNIYVAEWLGNRIRKISTNGIVTTIAGDGNIGFKNGKGINTEFHTPSGIALDSKNNIYVTEANNHCVRKIDTSGNVTTFAGNGTAGYRDATGTNALFSHPNRVTVDAQDNLYIADVFNYRIRKITPQRVVSTIAGNGVAGYVDGTANAAEFNYPNGVAVDTSGNVYVADYNNNRIRKISKAGIVTTVAGNSTPGYINANGTNAEFYHPGGICINAKGDFYITDESNNRIRKMTSSYDVSLLAGNGIAGDVDGSPDTAEFNDPRSIGIDNAGNVYVPDYNNNHIRKIEICDCTVPPTGLKATKVTATSALLKWTLIDCAIGYRAEYRVKGTTAWTVVNIPTNKDSIKITGLTANTTYQWQVATKCSISGVTVFSVYSPIKTFTTDASFTQLAVNNTDNSSVKPAAINIYPNPAHYYIAVQFNATKANSYIIQLTDVSGKILQTKTVAAAIGNNTIMLDLSHYAQSIYIIKLIDDALEVKTLKFSKE